MPPGGRGALESAFKVAARGQDQRGVVMEELVDTKVTGPIARQFSEQVTFFIGLKLHSTHLFILIPYSVFWERDHIPLIIFIRTYYTP